MDPCRISRLASGVSLNFNLNGRIIFGLFSTLQFVCLLSAVIEVLILFSHKVLANSSSSFSPSLTFQVAYLNRGTYFCHHGLMQWARLSHSIKVLCLTGLLHCAN
jgi:hypothetical protein